MDWQGIAAVIGAAAALIGAGGIGAIIRAYIERRTTDIRGELKIVTATLQHNETLRNDVDRLLRRIEAMEQRLVVQDRKIDELERENAELMSRCAKLERENAELRK